MPSLAIYRTPGAQSKNKKRGKATYKEQLEPLRNQRMVFIFDECHRSQFGENHKAIKEFFPNSQLFGFTGTPIFEQNATYQQIDGQQASLKTTADIFQRELHAYTITHAIEDRNVLSFHLDYFKSEGGTDTKTEVPQDAVVKAILNKHSAATANRKFNALLATASINQAIEYHRLFKALQAERQAEDEQYAALNIACVFSPPAEGDKDVKQLQEDLPQEKADNQQQPEQKKTALKAIIADYNRQYGSNHDINNFDLYYQDVQTRIKDQQYPNKDLKASTLLKDNPDIEKCLFVVDRKDLDRQTREEFNKFQEGCVEANTNTEAMVRRMLSTDYADKVIVTTIQKLGLALDGKHKKQYQQRLRPLSDKRMVFIFDECHRSQFGENHKAIKEFFPNAQLFGFTGTPIFEDNAILVIETFKKESLPASCGPLTQKLSRLYGDTRVTYYQVAS